MTRRLVDRALALLLPRRCAACGLPAGGANLCRGCFADLPWIDAACPRCGRPVPGSQGRCARCDIRLAGLDRAAAALVYEYPVDRILAAAKYLRRPDCAVALGQALARAVHRWRRAGEALAADVVVPVPLHPRRFARRGFNQALEIARPTARALGASLDDRLVRRVLDTPPQAGQGGRARRRLLRAAFAAAPAHGLRVVVVDDVVTTGSTVSAVARALRRAGATDVQALSAARVVAGGGQPGRKV